MLGAYRISLILKCSHFHILIFQKFNCIFLSIVSKYYVSSDFLFTNTLTGSASYNKWHLNSIKYGNAFLLNIIQLFIVTCRLLFSSYFKLIWPELTLRLAFPRHLSLELLRTSPSTLPDFSFIEWFYTLFWSNFWKRILWTLER